MFVYVCRDPRPITGCSSDSIEKWRQRYSEHSFEDPRWIHQTKGIFRGGREIGEQYVGIDIVRCGIPRYGTVRYIPACEAYACAWGAANDTISAHQQHASRHSTQMPRGARNCDDIRNDI